MEAKKRNAALVTAAFAGLMTLGASNAVAGDNQCWGVNKCKGTGACGGPGHSCAGQNGCKGKGWLEIDKETCLKIKGGSLTMPKGLKKDKKKKKES